MGKNRRQNQPKPVPEPEPKLTVEISKDTLSGMSVADLMEYANNHGVAYSDVAVDGDGYYGGIEVTICRQETDEEYAERMAEMARQEAENAVRLQERLRAEQALHEKRRQLADTQKEVDAAQRELKRIERGY